MGINKTESQILYSMSEVVTILNCGIGKHGLLALLRKREVLQDGNIAFQKYIEQGYFITHHKKVPTKFRFSRTYRVTLVTERGLSFIQALFKEGFHEEIKIQQKEIRRELEPDEMWITEIIEKNGQSHVCGKVIKYDPSKEFQYPKFLFEMPKAK